MEHISLKVNCESFIREALRTYCHEPTSLPRKAVALMLLVQAVELLLKQRLANHCELLLFENVDSPKHTVSMSKCLGRLARLNDLPAQGKDKKALDRAIDLRNQIVHHEFKTNEMALRADFVRLCGLLHDLRYELCGEPLFQLLSHKEREVLNAEKNVVNEVKLRAKSEIEKLYAESECGEPHSCIQCGNTSIKLSEGCLEYTDAVGTCLICGFSDEYRVCERCDKWLWQAELNEYGKNKMLCDDCIAYVTDDYMYESSVGKI